MTIVLQNLKTVYDGTSMTDAALHRNVDLYIEGDRIAKLVPHRGALAASDALQVVEASSYVLTPGLIDCHSHVTVEGLQASDMSQLNGLAGLLYVEKILYRSLVQGGVTTLRDMGGATHLMKRLVEDGVVLGPRLLVAICMLSTTGGHADVGHPDRCHGEVSRLFPPAPGRPSSLVDGPWDCRKRIREIAACGADFIKICAGRGLATGGGIAAAKALTDFTPEEMQALCGEAKERGLSVAAHAHSQAGIALAIASGVRDLQHITFMTADDMEAALRQGCTVTPTAWALHSVCTLPSSQKSIPNAQEIIAVHAEAVRTAARSGVPILVGSDPIFPGMHGQNYRELAFLVQAGIPALQAWYGATGLAAKVIGAADYGTVVAGQRADLLLFNADVVAEPAAFSPETLVEVIKDGFGHRNGVAALPQKTFLSTLEHRLRS